MLSCFRSQFNAADAGVNRTSAARPHGCSLPQRRRFCMPPIMPPMSLCSAKIGIATIRRPAEDRLQGRSRRRERVLVVQSAQHGPCAHERTRHPSIPSVGFRSPRRSKGRARYTRAQRAMWSSTVVMRHPLTKDRTQVPFRDRDHPVQALAPNRSDDPFADGIRLRTCER